MNFTSPFSPVVVAVGIAGHSVAVCSAMRRISVPGGKMVWQVIVVQLLSSIVSSLRRSTEEVAAV
jgi:hypothetical protein